MNYKGFAKHANTRPKEYILIWASDWNGDYWGFYAFINAENYKQDTKEILNLIEKLNWRDGDVQVQLIDHSKNLEEFYNYLYEHNYYNDWSTLNPELWEEALTKTETTQTVKQP